MTRHISEDLRRLVESKALSKCEYCKIDISDTYFGGEIDHIVSLKHGGKTEPDNLALACQICNRYKGTDLGSIHRSSKLLIRFYNPRIDDWLEHFRLDSSGRIEPLSEIGEVTANIFRFNDPERIIERLGLLALGRYTF